MKRILETDRLYLRELTLKDAIHFFQINNDPDVIKHTGDDPFSSIEHAEAFLKVYVQQYKEYHMGRWAVCLKQNDLFLGWCGLKYHPEEQLVDVGYRFYKKYWNNGYATEATKASITHGFKHLQLNKIVAHVHKDNLGSHHVVLKSGLAYVKDFTYNNQPAKFYEIKKIDYLTRL